MIQAHILESQLLKDRCLTNALEATSMILRVDDIIQSKTSDSDYNSDDHDHETDSHVHQSTGSYPWAIGH